MNALNFLLLAKEFRCFVSSHGSSETEQQRQTAINEKDENIVNREDWL